MTTIHKSIISTAILGLAPITKADPEVSPFAGVQALVDIKAERTAWFEEARFGMFIHWGPYSAAGGYWPPDPKTGKKYEQHYAEWIKVWAKVPEPEYGNLLKPIFTPDEGIIQSWAGLARDAGMKYAVLTTKHHDGYTLFNSTAPYSVDNDMTGGTNISPPGRDLVREFTDAFRDAGVVPGYYYSLIDWQHPAGEAYTEYLHHHLDELATNYGEVGVLWIDFSSAKTQGSHWGTRAILENWHAKQPQASKPVHPHPVRRPLHRGRSGRKTHALPAHPPMAGCRHDPPRRSRHRRLRRAPDRAVCRPPHRGGGRWRADDPSAGRAAGGCPHARRRRRAGWAAGNP